MHASVVCQASFDDFAFIAFIAAAFIGVAFIAAALIATIGESALWLPVVVPVLGEPTTMVVQGSFGWVSDD